MRGRGGDQQCCGIPSHFLRDIYGINFVPLIPECIGFGGAGPKDQRVEAGFGHDGRATGETLQLSVCLSLGDAKGFDNA